MVSNRRWATIFFVDGYSVVEQEAGESKNRAYDEKAVDAFFAVLGAHYHGPPQMKPISMCAMEGRGC